ncbi:MAG: hypothetical protein IPP49_02715 [Saprospiraceae bacterium]|nr:hypothetical protein [Saprospiraceae bacterium]
MNNKMNKLNLTLSLAFIAQITFTQSSSSESSGYLFYGVVALCAVLIIWAMLSIASNLMKIEGAKHGIKEEKMGFSLH